MVRWTHRFCMRRGACFFAALCQPVIVPLFCFTLFCSSGLLFLAEPMFAKMVLPLLGGTPAVWNTCMVSFQALLLAAYAYGHWSIKWLGDSAAIEGATDRADRGGGGAAGGDSAWVAAACRT